MNPRSRTNWTKVDEERFQELLKQRDEILKKNRQPLIDLVSDLYAAINRSQEQRTAQEFTVDFFVKYAERIRDALDPYDSGMRDPIGRIAEESKKNFGDL